MAERAAGVLRLGRRDDLAGDVGQGRAEVVAVAGVALATVSERSGVGALGVRAETELGVVELGRTTDVEVVAVSTPDRRVEVVDLVRRRIRPTGGDFPRRAGRDDAVLGVGAVVGALAL